MKRFLSVSVIMSLLNQCHPVHANWEQEFERTLEFKKPSIHQKMHKYLKQRKVFNHKYYADLICQQDISPYEKAVLAGMLPRESHGHVNVVSRTGCVGPWQVHPSWKHQLHLNGDLRLPPNNIKAAIKVYRIHLKDAKGNINKALVLYSGGAHEYVQDIRQAVQHILG